MSARRLAVAIPAYRRADLLESLLAQLPGDRVSRVYVSIDGPGPGAEQDVAQTIAIARDFARSATFPVLVHALPENVGAAANVLGAVRWMLMHEERGAVLEDDCHPIPGFFDFIDAALDAYDDRDDVWLACGTQVAPRELIDGNHVLSHYPLIWGWGTSRHKWERAMQALAASLEEPRGPWLLRSPFATPAERYWHGGHRRAAEGFVDAWDLPLVYAMRCNRASAVLPATPLVSNVGDDGRATHTVDDTRWTHLQPSPVDLPLRASSSACGDRVDGWLERELYGISARHLVSTSVRWLLDRVRGVRRRSPLRDRLARLDEWWLHAPRPERS